MHIKISNPSLKKSIQNNSAVQGFVEIAQPLQSASQIDNASITKTKNCSFVPFIVSAQLSTLAAQKIRTYTER